MSEQRTHVDFWFDPICPWAWMTSRWMLEVEQVRPVDTQFHIMSLAVLNEAVRPAASEYKALMATAMATGAGVRRGGRREGPPKSCAQLYTELGTRIHNEGPWFRATRPGRGG